MTKYIQKAEYETTQLDDEWIILDADAFTVTKLNNTGGFCWKLLRQSQTVESIMISLEREHSLVEKVERKDIELFLNKLIQCGLVVHAV